MIGIDRFVVVVYCIGDLNIILTFKMIKCKVQKWPTLELVPFGTEINFTMLFIILFLFLKVS